jgi:hypothetical protein
MYMTGVKEQGVVRLRATLVAQKKPHQNDVSKNNQVTK